MNQSRFLCLLFCGAAAVAYAGEPLSQGDRDFALSSLHASSKLFLDSIAGLSPAQLNFKPAPDRWSIAEVAEHIALSEDLIFGVVKKTLAQPADESKRLPPDEARKKDEALLMGVVDRSQKYQAPEQLQPQHKFPTVQAAADHFKESRNAHIEYVRTTQDDLRSHFSPHPAAGMLDADQWLLLMSAHTERHTKQINEVKADPNFPKQ
jgi:uncharacterized damage-inducible protein DinB